MRRFLFALRDQVETRRLAHPLPFLLFRRDRYSFNVGFQSNAVGLGDILLTLLFELLVEFIVDYIALNNELSKDIP